MDLQCQKKTVLFVVSLIANTPGCHRRAATDRVPQHSDGSIPPVFRVLANGHSCVKNIFPKETTFLTMLEGGMCPAITELRAESHTVWTTLATVIHWPKSPVGSSGESHLEWHRRLGRGAAFPKAATFPQLRTVVGCEPTHLPVVVCIDTSVPN